MFLWVKHCSAICIYITTAFNERAEVWSFAYGVFRLWSRYFTTKIHHSFTGLLVAREATRTRRVLGGWSWLIWLVAQSKRCQSTILKDVGMFFCVVTGVGDICWQVWTGGLTATFSFCVTGLFFPEITPGSAGSPIKHRTRWGKIFYRSDDLPVAQPQGLNSVGSWDRALLFGHPTPKSGDPLEFCSALSLLVMS